MYAISLTPTDAEMTSLYSQLMYTCVCVPTLKGLDRMCVCVCVLRVQARECQVEAKKKLSVQPGECVCVYKCA